MLDVLTVRAPFAARAAEVWVLVETKAVRGLVSAVSLSTIFYYARKSEGRDKAFAACKRIHDVFEIATVDAQVVGQALASGMHDFEDALQAFSGAAAGATHVVSRDATGFRGGPLPVLTPEQFIDYRTPDS